MNRLTTVIRNRPLVVLGATGILGATTYTKIKEEMRSAEDAKKKKVLVLPFHRMRIVEEKKSPASSLLANLADTINNNGTGTEKVIEMEADELVSLIHDAAEDPSIVSMFGIFGNGGDISTGGWAHLEEIRDALESFAKPPSSSEEDQEGGSAGTMSRGKPMYAYSNTFGGRQSMKEYYLASVFQQIHLQPQGDLNLYGLHATNVFFRDFLRKYGITVHVWKHGAYKNMANMFTHSNYSKEHYENTAGILLPIYKYVCKSIYESRYEKLKKYGYDFGKFWSMVENVGSLPADVARDIGFVDHLPLINPLSALVKNNKKEKRGNGESILNGNSNADESSKATTPATDDNEDNVKTPGTEDVKPKEPFIEENNEKIDKASVTETWKLQTDPDNFSADSQVFIDAYARQRVKLGRKRDSSSVVKALLSLVDNESEVS